MPRVHDPRAGSMQYWPRKRAKRIYPKIRSWLKSEVARPLGFAGYKVAMTHLIFKDNRQNSRTRGENVFFPITILECPPLKILALKLYKNTTYGLVPSKQIYNPKLDKELARKINLPKKIKDQINEIENKLNDYSELRLLVYTQPRLTTIGKKKPEIFEIALGGTIQEQFNYAKSMLDKEVRISEIFKEGQYLDTHSVSIGKGLQGPVKRFGVSLKSHKSEKKRRSSGNLGSWNPSKVLSTVPQKGQLGFQTRTEYNKLLIKMSNDTKLINPKGGFNSYGLVKNDYVLIKGSITGPVRRLIRLTPALRNQKLEQPLEINYISLKSS